MMNSMKCALLSVCVFFAACNPLPDTQADIQADTQIKDNHIAKDYWQGQWRVVNIWAEWCKPCWKEIPELNQFYAAQKDSDIKLMGFNFDELGPEELMVLKEKMSIDFPILNDWPDVWTKPEVMGLPATVIIAPNNIIINILWGEQTLASLTKAIDDAKNVAKINSEILAK